MKPGLESDADPGEAAAVRPATPAHRPVPRAGALGLRGHAGRFVRFGLVGLSGVAVNTAALYLLVGVGGLGPLLGAALATEAAILSNFVLNDRWTFREAERRESLWLWRALRYNSVASGGLVISLAVLAGLTYLLGLHYLLANLFAIGAGTLWNYTGSHLFTWSR